ncbi:hypothetical protein ACFX2I_011791 [Malus domestica]
MPSRSGSNFLLFDISNTPSEGRDDSSSAYGTLLRAALFGPDSVCVVPPAMLEKRSAIQMNLPSPNIFCPVKAPLKVPRSPYKVLDAPALQDDFYLNLVDWSSHNVCWVGKLCLFMEC